MEAEAGKQGTREGGRMGAAGGGTNQDKVYVFVYNIILYMYYMYSIILYMY